MNHNDFNKETIDYLKIVMNVYSAIKDKDIIKNVNHLREIKNYKFTSLDKKVLALFIASFLVDGDLKTILEEYDNLKLTDFLSFANLDIKQIKPLVESEYASFYREYIQLDLIDIVKAKRIFYDIDVITPTVILNCLDGVRIGDSNILNYFNHRFEIMPHWFHEHPLFDELKRYNLIKGYLKNKDILNPLRVSLPKFGTNRSSLNFPSLEQNSQQPASDVKILDFNNDKVWELLDEIQQKFIGQEVAAEWLFYNIINNQHLVEMGECPDGQRSIIFLDGPTGTGKTAITREITKKLGLPFASVSITNYSSTGYVGGNITDILETLYNRANGNIQMAQRGIVVLDEFDKIAYSGNGGLEMKKAVQQQLLDFLGGGKYSIKTGKHILDTSEVEFDTSQLTFVCLSALTDLRNDKTARKKIVGFRQDDTVSSQQEYTITPQDLIDIGLEKELVGRFNTYLYTEEYSKETLLKILKESTISPMISFRKWVEDKNKQLYVDEDVYELIAEQAYELNTGARSLQTVMNNIRTRFIKEVLRGSKQIIHLDSKTVLKVGQQTKSRVLRT